MTAVQPKKKTYTFAEYRQIEQSEGIRYEFWDGEIFAMAGSTKRHNSIVQNMTFVLRTPAKRSGCKVYSENVRQKLNQGERYVYPDVIYTCHPDDIENDMAASVTSPSLLIEVISASTERTDTHDKRPHYTKLPSLLYYVLIHQTTYRAEVFERNVDFWKYRLIEGADAVLDLPLLDVVIPMADVYDGITLPAEDLAPDSSNS